ncbi:biopolymer transporter [Symplocastrum sp. BBK-W-15]|uniref:Biopolymer transporter n=2 Tax=Limnofasciculus TaxID=3064905 RepID=A0AAE3KSA1_9CYAN|nr:biopolymer transporter [Limnofasciculus baicalensis]MCP2732448.1 biopolymer transporter [Limnofasciculus baicalensis BBK-W-15]
MTNNQQPITNNQQPITNNKILIILIIMVGLTATGCVNQFTSPPQIITGGLNSNRPDEFPAYSSDGRYLAFASDRNRSRDIFLYNLQERRLIDLPNLNRRDSSQDQPALSADGRFIAYLSNERGKSDILVYDRQSQRSQLLTAGVRGSVRHPTITGDGRYVAYETSQLGQWHIVIVERDIE